MIFDFGIEPSSVGKYIPRAVPARNENPTPKTGVYSACYDRSSPLRRDFLRIASLILVILACLSPLRADSDASADDRSTALWVIRKGGRVLIDRQAEYISDAFDLPDGTIRIIGIDM